MPCKTKNSIMRQFKQNPLMRLVNSYLVDSPQPANLSYAWNFGSILASCLGLQIVTGVILAMCVALAYISLIIHYNHQLTLR